jgi:hypothetical protein
MYWRVARISINKFMQNIWLQACLSKEELLEFLLTILSKRIQALVRIEE